MIQKDPRPAAVNIGQGLEQSARHWITDTYVPFLFSNFPPIILDNYFHHQESLAVASNCYDTYLGCNRSCILLTRQVDQYYSIVLTEPRTRTEDEITLELTMSIIPLCADQCVNRTQSVNLGYVSTANNQNRQLI